MANNSFNLVDLVKYIFKKKYPLILKEKTLINKDSQEHVQNVAIVNIYSRKALLLLSWASCLLMF